jgi:DNA topoisomerase-1
LQNKAEEIDARRRRPHSHWASPTRTIPICVRVGRYGPFIEQGERRASLREDMPPDELTVEKALELLDQAAQAEEPLGVCPTTHKPVFLKVGRFGPYVQRGTPEDEEKPKNASLLKGMKPEDVTLEVALKLLELPRELGVHPQSALPVVAYNGRFGPYVKCGDDTRSLLAGMSPVEVTLEQALELLAQPKAMRRGFGAPKEPLKLYEESPVTKQKVQLLEGRYGLYLTDGETNASLPKGADPESLTLPQALELLAARAALGPPAKKGARRKASGARSKAKKAPAAKPAAAIGAGDVLVAGSTADGNARPKKVARKTARVKTAAVKTSAVKKVAVKKAAKQKTAAT